MTTKILVLGSQGMLGHTVYNHLRSQFPKQVFGTSRKSEDGLYSLQVETAEKDIKKIVSETKVKYIINCIGLITHEKDEKKLLQVNCDFPQVFSTFSEKNNIKFIHISSDGVFGDEVGTVNESDIPAPSDPYGRSKLLGEPKSLQSISVRTSIIGFDQENHRGLLEWAKSTEGSIYGYNNQLWSGATTLQVAKLCEKIIRRNAFGDLRKKSHIFHFAPIRGITKYDILVALFAVMPKNQKVIKKNGNPISRQLISRFEKDMWFDKFSHHINDALQELLAFEKMNQ